MYPLYLDSHPLVLLDFRYLHAHFHHKHELWILGRIQIFKTSWHE